MRPGLGLNSTYPTEAGACLAAAVKGQAEEPCDVICSALRMAEFVASQMIECPHLEAKGALAVSGNHDDKDDPVALLEKIKTLAIRRSSAKTMSAEQASAFPWLPIIDMLLALLKQYLAVEPEAGNKK